MLKGSRLHLLCERLYGSEYAHSVLPRHHRGGLPWQPSAYPFSEHFLQLLWNNRLVQDSLCCEEGRHLQIIHPGIWNVSGGPDFKDAAIVLDGHLLHGDVEIHQRTSDWLRHGHSGNPAYSNVVLHVVWRHDMPVSGAPSPTLALEKAIIPSWHLLIYEVEEACYSQGRPLPKGQCAMRWALTDDANVQEVLAVAGLARFDAKASQFAHLAASITPDQALYQLFFEALGYKKNRLPFRMLTEALPLSDLAASCSSLTDLEAAFFGSAGLLPDPTQTALNSGLESVVPDLWNAWWKQGRPRHGLPWDFSETRPLNHPCRRLAAGIRWLWQTGFQPSRWLQRLGSDAASPQAFLQSLLHLDLDIPHWRSARDFRTAISPPAALLGSGRLNDILANVLLPALAAHPLSGTFPSAGQLARQAFLLLPKLQPNRTLADAIQRFLMPPSRSKNVLKHACHQQGLHYIYANFCQVLFHDCSQCPFSGHQAQDEAPSRES